MNTFTMTLTVAAALWMTGCSADRKALTGNHMASTDSLTIELNSFLQKSLIPGFSVSIVNDKFNIATLWSVSAAGTRLHFGGNTGVCAFVYFNPKTGTGALAYCNLRDNSFGELLDIVRKYESTATTSKPGGKPSAGRFR